MTQENRHRRREAAREYWQRHGIDEGADGSPQEQEEVVVAKRPLKAMLSLRLGDDDLRELTLLARENDVGVTTMARKLLRESLVQSRGGLSRRQTPEMAYGMVADRAGEPYSASGDDDGLYVLSRRALDDICGAVQAEGARLLAAAVREGAVHVGPKRGEMYDLLRGVGGLE